MKGKRLFALLTLGLLALGGILLGTAKSYSPVVAEEPQTTEPATPTFEEKTYTYSDDNGTSKITLTSETEFTIEVHENGKDPTTSTGTYTKDGNVLTLTLNGNELKVVIDDTTMTFGEYVETYECKVVLDNITHGNVSIDKEEGHIGDIITITANADLFYLVENVSVNGIALIEDETTTGVYRFALVEGENKISAKFIIDKELLGEMSTLVEQASNKDWTNLFSVKNIITVVAFLLNSGILFAIARYYIKDKKLEKKVENKIETTVSNVLPDASKKIILEALEKLITPYFAQIQATTADLQVVMATMCRCLALAQEGTPEARIAITKELSALSLSDNALITAIQEKIEKFMKEQGDKMAQILNNLATIENNSEQIVEQANQEDKPSEEPADNGTQYE